MLKLIVRTLNSISRLLLGVGIFDLFEKASGSKSEFRQAIELAQKHRYIAACKIGKEVIDQWYTRQSKAEGLFRRWLMADFLKSAKQQVSIWEYQAQQEYDAALERSHWLATEGRWQEAITLLEPVQQQFSRPQGKKLLNRLYQIIAGKTSFHLGLLAEQAGNFQVAIEHYQNAIAVSPAWKLECQIRLSLIAVKSENWTEAIFHLQNINTQQAAYIRGFALVKQGNWQQAQQEWREYPQFQVPQQPDAQRDRHQAQREIQELVAANNLAQARLKSQQYLQEFGDDQIVKDNLEKNILPRLLMTLWREQEWQILAEVTEQIWRQAWEINALHNLALASYYQAIDHADKLADLIVIWSTAIANLHLNPLLQNLSWLGENSLDLHEIANQLQQRLETLLKEIEAENVAEYNRLFELYRLEVKALNLMGTPPNIGLRVKGLFITPGFYQRYRQKFKVKLLAGKPLWALYTNWAQSVLACMEGDAFTAMQIQPKTEPIEDVEIYARNFVAYHQGCYYLDIPPGGYPRWRSAVAALKLAQSEIHQNPEWLDNIEKLCQKQYQAVAWNSSEAQEFAQFWYDLIASSTAKFYLEKV